MRESISYTVTLNFVITFIIVVFAFLSGTLIYFKSNKTAKTITNSIEKYEGYNELSEEDIYRKLFALGYNMKSMNCVSSITAKRGSTTTCDLVINDDISHSSGDRGYCVYLCNEDDYYYYRIKTRMLFNIPLVNELLDFPIFSNTNRLYDFETKLTDRT